MILDASLKMNSLLYIVVINLNINLKKIMCRKFKGLLKLMFEYLTHKVKFQAKKKVRTFLGMQQLGTHIQENDSLEMSA